MMWEALDSPLDCRSSWRGWDLTQCAFMINHIFISDLSFCLAYNPRKNEWRSWGSESLLISYWHEPFCVIDNMMYCINPASISENPIRVYDPKKDVWSYVRNVPTLPEEYSYTRARIADCGGMLVILASQGEAIWRIEVDLTTREVEGVRKIWGYIRGVQLRVLGDKVHSMKLCGYVEV